MYYIYVFLDEWKLLKKCDTINKLIRYVKNLENEKIIVIEKTLDGDKIISSNKLRSGKFEKRTNFY